MCMPISFSVIAEGIYGHVGLYLFSVIAEGI